MRKSFSELARKARNIRGLAAAAAAAYCCSGKGHRRSGVQFGEIEILACGHGDARECQCRACFDGGCDVVIAGHCAAHGAGWAGC